MAAALLARHLAAIGSARGGEPVRISSAGLLVGGQPSSAHAIATMLARGVDLRPHRSRTLVPEIVRAADLVVAMERAHLRAAAVMVPGGPEKTFTLRELLRRAVAQAGALRDRPGGRLDVAAWLGALNVERDVGSLVRDDPAEEVWDPVGGSRADFERTADELDQLTGQLAQLLFVGR
jgi:protein-tyrosine phosphatase